MVLVARPPDDAHDAAVWMLAGPGAVPGTSPPNGGGFGAARGGGGAAPAPASCPACGSRFNGMQALQPLGGRRPSACLSTCTSEASISSLDDGQDARAPGPNPADDPPGGGGRRRA